MATGTSTFMGLGMGLFGEYELTQIASATDCFTITGASTTGTGTLFTIQNSAGTPAVNGLRVYDYGRTRIIRTDDTEHGGTFKNALDVKFDHNTAATASSQLYAASFIMDTSGGTWPGGRVSVIQLQSYGSAGVSGASGSWIHMDDHGTYEVGAFLSVLDSTIGASGMLQGLSSPSVTHGLVMYWQNTKYWIMVCDAST